LAAARPEEDARIRIESIADAAARQHAAMGLDRLEAARERIAAASRDELVEALDEFDRVFEDLSANRPRPRQSLPAVAARRSTWMPCAI
jgi:hypothetical protein